MLKIFSILFFPLSFVNAYGQQATYAASESGREAGIDFEENKGQWPAQVHFMADIHGGRVFFENGAFTYVLHSLDDLEKIHSESHEKNTPMEAGKVQCHAFQVRFEGSNSYHVPNGNDELKFHRNYFHGNDPSKWAADVRMYQGITYPEIYAGIDLRVYGNGSNLEYDYIVVPGGDPGLIREAYHGLDAGAWQLTKEGSIILQTALGNITQLKPVAYQIINGKRKEVKVAYRFQGNSPDDNTFGYHFPEGFNTQHELIIDPVLVAATYSGSTSTNYGHCATYDAQGNIYTGAISFAQGYPVTAGAFQTTFGGSVDIAISKLDPTGSALLYATYIGGMSQDYPHSLVVNTSGQLYVYGSTMSTNFPTTAGSFDQTHNGIADIIVAGLSATGNSLIGSTFVGGTANDGWNNLTYNYGDTYRGEIILDGNDNPYIASTTNSANFPVTAGSYDNTSNGAHDAVVFKLNPALTSLMWSTFLGGSQDDGANGLVLNATGDVYVCGSTQSFNFPVLPGTINSSFIGGSSDGFVFLLSNNGSAMTTSTFFGTSGNDFIFFTDLDGSGNVYVFGQSDIAINPTSGVYANPGSPQFIASMDPGLFSINFQTVFGGGNMNDRISPTAFMVDVCDHVYAAGWGDVTAYPVTSNAIQPTTDGSDFYLIVLDMNATSLIHATYFGGTGWEHVDGGTSRFDPNGIVYEAICQNATNMTTTPGAYSPNNMAGSYDIAVFKIDFQAVGVIAQASAAPSDTICLNDLAQFSNNSLNATDYIWNFGDGSPLDTNAAPSHFFLTSGTFNVMLVAMDSTSCNIADTVYLVMTVLPLPTVDLGNDTTICGTVNLVLNASSPNVTYNWSTGATTSSITATVPGTYWVVVDNGFCQATDTIQILSFQPPDIGSDTSFCAGNSIILDAGNPGLTYQWNTGATSQTITVNSTGIYWVNVSAGSCTFRDSIDVTVISVPQPNLGPDTSICPGTLFSLAVTDPTPSYLWSNGSTELNIPVETMGMYWVVATIGNCTASDSVNVNFLVSVYIGSDYSLCDLSRGLVLNAGNPGAQYLWNTGATSQSITINEAGTYWVEVSNGSNCLLVDTITIDGNIGGGMVYMPNCFTPGIDQVNDIFRPVATGVTEFHMQVFNRWGELMFETFSMENGWDGRYNGNYVQQDVYAVKVEYKTICSGNEMVRKMTHVTVLPRL